MVDHDRESFLHLIHHPVCADSDASLLFLTGAATPPGQEGRSPRVCDTLITAVILSRFLPQSLIMFDADDHADAGVEDI